MKWEAGDDDGWRAIEQVPQGPPEGGRAQEQLPAPKWRWRSGPRRRRTRSGRAAAPSSTGCGITHCRSSWRVRRRRARSTSGYTPWPTARRQSSRRVPHAARGARTAAIRRCRFHWSRRAYSRRPQGGRWTRRRHRDTNARHRRPTRLLVSPVARNQPTRLRSLRASRCSLFHHKKMPIVKFDLKEYDEAAAMLGLLDAWADIRDFFPSPEAPCTSTTSR